MWCHLVDRVRALASVVGDCISWSQAGSVWCQPVLTTGVSAVLASATGGNRGSSALLICFSHRDRSGVCSQTSYWVGAGVSEGDCGTLPQQLEQGCGSQFVCLVLAVCSSCLYLPQPGVCGLCVYIW